MTVSDHSAEVTLRAAVMELTDRVMQLADNAGRSAILTLLEAEKARWHTPTTSVIVVGEAKRGKSSLLNGLLGTPNLLPVAIDIATNTHIVVRHGPELTSTVYLDRSEEGRTIPVDKIADWASEAGNPEDQKGVRVVEVRLPHPLLAEGLVLIDTPGVGGLAARHVDITLSVLPSADALLFVSDADAPISAPELSFLKRAAARVDTVIFVLTKRDLFHGWPRILEINRSNVAKERDLRFVSCSFLSVSSRLKALADERKESRPDEAGQFREESGFDHLEREIRGITGAGRLLRLANVLRVAVGVLDQLKVPELIALQPDSNTTKELETFRRRLADLQQGETTWPVLLTNGCDKLHDDLLRLLEIELDRLANRYLDESTPWITHKNTLLRDLRIDLRGLAVRLEVGLNKGIANMAQALRDQLPGVDLVQLGNEVLQQHTPIELAPTRFRRPLSERPRPTPGTQNLVGSTFTATSSLMANPFYGVVVSAAQVISALVNVYFQAVKELRERAWSVLESAHAEAIDLIASRIMGVRQRFKETVQNLRAGLLQAAEAEARKAEELHELDQAARQRARNAAEERLEELRLLEEEARRLSEELVQLRSAWCVTVDPAAEGTP